MGLAAVLSRGKSTPFGTDKTCANALCMIRFFRIFALRKMVVVAQ